MCFVPKQMRSFLEFGRRLCRNCECVCEINTDHASNSPEGFDLVFHVEVAQARGCTPVKFRQSEQAKWRSQDK